MDDTVCLTKSTTASFTCVVDRGGIDITTAYWHILAGGVYVPIGVRERHMANPTRNGDILTDTLTVTNVSVNDNGALYRCEPIRDVISIPVTITTLGEVIIILTKYNMIHDHESVIQVQYVKEPYGILRYILTYIKHTCISLYVVLIDLLNGVQFLHLKTRLSLSFPQPVCIGNTIMG